MNKETPNPIQRSYSMARTCEKSIQIVEAEIMQGSNVVATNLHRAGPGAYEFITKATKGKLPENTVLPKFTKETAAAWEKGFNAGDFQMTITPLVVAP